MLEFTFVCMEAQTSSVNCIVVFFLLALLYLTLFSGLLYDVVTHWFSLLPLILMKSIGNKISLLWYNGTAAIPFIMKLNKEKSGFLF